MSKEPKLLDKLNSIKLALLEVALFFVFVVELWRFVKWTLRP